MLSRWRHGNVRDLLSLHCVPKSGQKVTCEMTLLGVQSVLLADKTSPVQSLLNTRDIFCFTVVVIPFTIQSQAACVFVEHDAVREPPIALQVMT